jgi:iron complex transport system ATP-binding protein
MTTEPASADSSPTGRERARLGSPSDLHAGALAFAIERAGVTIGGRSILSDVSWSVPAGARAALLGPNGGGKSTFLRLLTGYQYPTEGTVTVLGETIGRTVLDDLRRRIGLVDPAGPWRLDDATPALDAVLTGWFGHLCLHFDEPTPEQVEAGRRALTEVGLGQRATQPFGTMSQGEQRRVLLARATVAGPELLILDEPCSGLDLLARESWLATLERLLNRRPELTALVVTHHLEELPPGLDQCLVLANGRAVATGTPSTALTGPVLSAAFGVPVEVRERAGRWSWHVDPANWAALAEPG